jgi:uncharacterized Zn ribbon protein
MPSLLQKNSFFDHESGRQFVATDDGFYWKEAKKNPEDSKVTRLLQQYGWELKNGNDVWLIFKRPRQPGELFVIRGEKRWYFDMPGDDLLSNSGEGQGLDSLQRALQSGAFGGKAKAMHAGAPSTAVNNAGNGHEEVEGDPLFEHRVGAKKPKCPHCGSDDYGLMPSDFETAKCNDCGKNWDHGIIEGINNPYPKAARKPMHDDSGAQTGLRNRPDYGESDSYTVQMNEANSKEASILVLDGGVKTGSVTAKARLFVTGATFDGMTLERFTFSPDPRKAASFGKLTAQNLSRQLKGKFGVTANVLPAKA